MRREKLLDGVILVHDIVVHCVYADLVVVLVLLLKHLRVQLNKVRLEQLIFIKREAILDGDILYVLGLLRLLPYRTLGLLNCLQILDQLVKDRDVLKFFDLDLEGVLHLSEGSLILGILVVLVILRVVGLSYQWALMFDYFLLFDNYFLSLLISNLLLNILAVREYSTVIFGVLMSVLTLPLLVASVVQVSCQVHGTVHGSPQ